MLLCVVPFVLRALFALPIWSLCAWCTLPSCWLWCFHVDAGTVVACCARVVNNEAFRSLMAQKQQLIDHIASHVVAEEDK